MNEQQPRLRLHSHQHQHSDHHHQQQDQHQDQNQREDDVGRSAGETILSRIQLDDLLGLVGCAAAHSRFPEMGFADPDAAAIVEWLRIDVERVFAENEHRRIRAAAAFHQHIDSIVRGFFSRQPHGLAVSLFAGVCTRFPRIDNGSLRYVELDSRGITGIKCSVIQSSFARYQRWVGRHVLASCCSIGCLGWMKKLADAADVDMPTIIVAPSTELARADTATRDDFFTQASLHLPAGTEIIVAHDIRSPLRASASSTSTSASGAPSLEMLDDRRATWTRFPRLRFVSSASSSLHDTSVLGQSVAHLRVVG